MGIITALENKEKLMIYGDYDVDGTTAVSLIYSFLKNYFTEIDYYIPDRYSEGYGVSLKGIDHAARNGYSLVIALDCGIKAVEKIKSELEPIPEVKVILDFIAKSERGIIK